MSDSSRAEGAPVAPAPAPAPGAPGGLREVAAVFLKLGFFAFGGPAAHIAMMEEEVVRRRRWLTTEEFLDLLGATNLIPGPNSTEMAIHLGLRRAGWRGLLIAGACFILPAVGIVLAIAWAYVRYGSLPTFDAVLYGVKPVVMAVIAVAFVRLGMKAVRSSLLAICAVVAAAASVLGSHELLVLFGAALFVLAARALFWRAPPDGAMRCIAAPLAPIALLAQSAAPALAGGKLLTLFGVFAKVGAILFGSGYVLLAYLRADLVERLGWLTESQLVDAIVVGQVTPGPVFTTATFIGYVVAGAPGAIVATIGIFLPAFFFVAISGPLVPKLRESRIAGACLDGLNVASLALLAVVAWRLGGTAFVDLATIAVGVTSLALLLALRINPAWLVLGGAIFGWLAHG